jgi:probable phosphoglycerate mutase
MLRLFLLRHGQTDFNLRNIVQGGGVDSDLNDHGRQQAQHFYEAWKAHEFDGLYSSLLRRSRQTLMPFEQLGHQITPMGEMNELNWGVIEGKEADAEVRAAFDDVNERWTRGNLQARMEGGESPLEAWARIERGLDQLWRLHPKGGNVLVCTHGRLLRILLAGALGYGLHRMNLFPHENTGLNVLRMNRYGRFMVERLNDLSHLPRT